MSRAASWGLFWIVAAVLAVAGSIKVTDPEAFLSSVLTYELFSYKLAAAIALFVPWLELVVAASLATGIWRRGAVWLGTLLLLGFIAVVVQARMRGLAVDCGCFGSNQLDDNVSYAKKIGENVALLACLWMAAALRRPRDLRSRE